MTTDPTCKVDEELRLEVLSGYGILDTPEEKAFDDVVKLLSDMLDVPIAAVNLIAEDRQWFKSEIGLGTREMPLDNSICRFALLEESRMIVPDTLADPRFDCNPLVTGEPGLRFYAGVLLKTPDGVPLGTLCVLDLKPRPNGLTARQLSILETLAQQVMTQMELRKAIKEQKKLLAQHEAIQEELRRERDQTQQLLQGMDEGFLLLDEEFKVKQINSGGLRFELRSAHEMIGKSHWELWPGSENLPFAHHYKHAMSERMPVAFEGNYVFPDGRSFWTDIRAYPADGGLAIFYRDISDRKKTDIELREAVDRLQFTLQAAQIGDWDLDLESDKAYRSLRHDQCFGYTEPIEEWGFENFIHHVHPEDREFVAGQFEISLRKFKDWNFECRVVWPDQTIHWIAAHGSIYQQDSKPKRMSGIVYEITERKQAEYELLESQRQAIVLARNAENERRRLDALLEVVPVGIIVADATGALTQVNAENRRIWGQHPMSSDTDEYSDWKGWWADGSERHGQALQPHEWAMARALKGEPSPRQIIEVESFDRPGSRRIVLNSGAPIRNEAGEIVGAVVAQMDITERVKAEEALREADQKKDEFLAMLAHELRNPLAPITAAAAVLAARRCDETTVQRASTIIARQAKHMSGLIDDLLDVSRVTRGKVELDNNELDAKDIVADAIEQVRPLIERHAHRLAVQLSPTHATILGDRKRLVQVVTNLLNNAAKYTPDGGNIEISLESDADTITIAVHDNGIGMTQDLIANAFELFSQGTRALDRSQGGLGIGLALVKRLVHLHKGTVNARSSGPGAGSVFEVKLPRSNGSVKQTKPSAESVGNTKLRIAIVDDNEDAATTLALFLESFDHEILTVFNATDALRLLPTFKPDVCLLDIGLPDLDGFQLAKAIRSIPTAANAVLLAITGYAQDRDRNEAFSAGFNDLFAKPVELTALAARLQKVADYKS